MLPNDRHGHARCLLQHRDKEIGRVDHQTARAAGMVKRQLANKLCCRRDAWLAASAGRQRAQVLFDGLEDGIRVQLDVPHRLGEDGPFDLRKGQKQMLAGE